MGEGGGGGGNPEAVGFRIGRLLSRLFQSGRSQAVRLPKEHRFAGAEVAVKHFGNGAREAINAAPALPFDDVAAWVYGNLRTELERRGTPIGSLDTLIAAHALSRRATLVTHDTREFSQVPGLLLDDWAASAGA